MWDIPVNSMPYPHSTHMNPTWIPQLNLSGPNMDPTFSLQGQPTWNPHESRGQIYLGPMWVAHKVAHKRPTWVPIPSTGWGTPETPFIFMDTVLWLHSDDYLYAKNYHILKKFLCYISLITNLQQECHRRKVSLINE